MTAGIDAPDRRGRTGLDRIGRELTGNDDVRVRDVELLAGDRGNGATVLLDDVVRRTVLLTRQFRFPAYVNGHPDGLLPETAAGLLVDDDPVTAGRRRRRRRPGTGSADGGGLAEEGEDIEVVERGIDEALAQIGGGIVDAKTILLRQWAVLSGPFAR